MNTKTSVTPLIIKKQNPIVVDQPSASVIIVRASSLFPATYTKPKDIETTCLANNLNIISGKIIKLI